MCLWFQQKVEVIVTHEIYIRSVSAQVPAPAVLRMKKYIKPRQQKTVRLSRENIFLRDTQTCQYCAKKFPTKELTLDHVMPVSRGGGKSWENLTTACHHCNRRKGNRTPEEAAMPLLHKPERLKWSPTFDVQVKTEKVDRLWMPYLDVVSIINF